MVFAAVCVLSVLFLIFPFPSQLTDFISPLAFPAGHLDFVLSVGYSQGLAVVLLHRDATRHRAGAPKFDVSALFSE